MKLVFYKNNFAMRLLVCFENDLLRNLYLHSWASLLPFSEPLAKCLLITCYWWFFPNKTPCLPGILPHSPCLQVWNFKEETSKPLKFCSSSKLTSICSDLLSLTHWGLLTAHSGFLWAVSTAATSDFCMLTWVSMHVCRSFLPFCFSVFLLFNLYE